MEINLTQPPLKQRLSILNEYEKAKRLMGFEQANRAYRRSMRDLYERYNPKLAWLREQRERAQGYSEDY